MFDKLKGLLGDQEAPQAARTLAAPDQLMTGDVIKFQFMAQPELSGKQFEVAAITTYDFEHGAYAQFALKGETSELMFLSVHERKGETYLAISKKITREDVEGLFDLDLFAEVFEEGPLTIPATSYEPLKTWQASGYFKDIDCQRGYRHIGDYRHESLPEFEEDAEGIDYYRLLDKSEKHAIEIEVGDHDDSDVYITVYQPVSVIAEMWPA